MKRVGGILVICFLTGCFGIDRNGGILHYDRGRVTTGYGSFQVGRLPAGWSGPKIRKKELIYSNREEKGTIVVDALCGPKFDDAPLPLLAKNLFYQIESPELKEPKMFRLAGSAGRAGRSALEMEGKGAIDGVPIGMEAVVFKKDQCLYDFVYFAPRDLFPRGQGDFEEFVHAARTP